MKSFGQTLNLTRRGFTLVELIIAIATLATIVSIALPSMMKFLNEAKISKAITDIKFMEKEIIMYSLGYGDWPDSLADMGKQNFEDPWGRTYEYLKIACDETKGKCKAPKGARRDKFLKPVNWDFDLYSIGVNGESHEKFDHWRSVDDVVRAVNGGYVGLAAEF